MPRGKQGKARKRATASLKVGAKIPNLGQGALEFGLNTRNARQVPVAKTRQKVQLGPRMTTSGGGKDLAVRIRHREFVADIAGSEEFFLDEFAINAGLEALFPWLAGVASNFESYEFASLRFVYEPQCPTTDGGTVMIAVDYDATDAPPADKVAMMTLQGAVRSAVWSDVILVCPPRDLVKFVRERYVRNGVTPSNTDIKTYDVGNLFLATQGAPTTLVGELYVEYEVVLKTPTWEGSVLSVAIDSFNITNTTGTTIAPFAGAGIVTSGALPCDVVSTTTVRVRRIGRYLINWRSVLASSTPTNGVTTSITAVSDSAASSWSPTVRDSQYITATSVYVATSSDATFTLAVPSGATANLTSLSVVITQLEEGMPTLLGLPAGTQRPARATCGPPRNARPPLLGHSKHPWSSLSFSPAGPSGVGVEEPTLKWKENGSAGCTCHSCVGPVGVS